MIKFLTKQNKKSNASIAGSIIIFIIAFLVFCICAVDTGAIVTSRYKAQKVTETIALYMASYLASLPEDLRTKESLDPIKERFENLYSDYTLSSIYRFEITETDIKNDEKSTVKIKVTTQTSTPTIFLRYAGIGIINIMQTAYAKTYTSELTQTDTTTDTYTFKADEIITDKNGSDIQIEYNRPYLAFAGLKKGNSGDDDIYWVEIGSMSSDSDKTHFVISDLDEDESYDTSCISKDIAVYDFSSDKNKTIGLVQYIKIIKTDTCNPDGTKEESAAAENTPVVLALNSVKIINRDTFLKD